VPLPETGLNAGRITAHLRKAAAQAPQRAPRTG
jgi:hypothetical protein